ncbi:MAG: HlyD family type I secretion periplasmic adaptor subunit [Lentisphaeria bacterium]|nr:HlyD family type I secretion periplasmic adaptor subunit [Lentisphaerota bacterium]MBR2624878.1 HlyD family type I secretion periplasmic adaptor subunit [Lentisphaeria bacterium]
MSSKKKLNSVAVDFQPDAVEIAMRPLPFAARLGVWIGIVFFVGSLVASYFCKVDVIVNGTGKLVSVNQNIVMKPLDRTVIKSIDVKVGEVVKEGQLLMTFDPAINQAEEERLTSEYSSSKAQYERWLAEYENKKYKPEVHNQDEKRQLEIYNRRQDYYREKILSLDEAIVKIDIKIKEDKKLLENQKQLLELCMKQVKREEGLIATGAGMDVRLDEYRQAYLRQEQAIIELERTISESSHLRSAANAEKNTFISEWRKDIAENLVGAEQSMNTIKKSLDKVLQLNEYIQLRAPCDAIVHEIANFPVGSAVREAEALITLVPINCEIELEAKIPAQDIGRVKVGDSVRVKLNAFPFQKHGTLDGVIRTISEDTFQENTQESELQSPTYYRSRITLSGSLRNVHDNFRLIPGMEVQAEIKVGTRSVLEYVIHPLIKSLDEAIREP